MSWTPNDIEEAIRLNDPVMRGAFLKAFLMSVALPEDVRCGLCPKPKDEAGAYTFCVHCCNTKRTPIPFSEVWCR